MTIWAKMRGGRGRRPAAQGGAARLQTNLERASMAGGAATDPHWQATAAALRAAGAAPACVLAPEGFAAYLPKVREYRGDANVARIDGPNIAWLVVHKNHLGSLDGHGLAAMLVGARLIFANEVFGVFAMIAPERRGDPHVASFIARLRDRAEPEAPDPVGPPRSPAAYRPRIAELARPDRRGMIEQYSEERCFAAPMPDETILCRVLGSYMMWVDARDHGLSPHLIMQGYWEMWITQALAKLAAPGTTAIDVGANVGYYTLLLADAVGPSGRVISFEPNPRMADMLRRSVSINGFGARVTVRNEAVSATAAGGLSFAIPRHEPKNASLVSDDAHRKAFLQAFGDELDFIDVPAITLDSLGLENVGVVKIDAEGAERAIWNGMQQTIARNPDIRIVLEYNAGRLQDPMGFLSDMSGLFRTRHIDFDGVIKPLTPEMVKTERIGEDWMVFLSRE
ncbi:MAG: FkbM family methyltransferase [Rhodospirillales bacterium]|jgi:FkbM family methyltransferase|nr:FkbM family methyltransferase [Rhodospirillales bacterium]